MRLHHESWIHRASALAVAGALCSTVLGLFAPHESGEASAQPGPPQAPTTQCSLRGQVRMPADTPIASALGSPIARFSGAPTRLVIGDFPSDAQGKVEVQTGFGAGSFRIHGFVAGAQLPLFAVANLPVSPGHVFIAATRGVTFAGSRSGRLRVEKKLSAPFDQTFRATVACGALALEAGTPSGFSTPGNARGYELKQTSLDLYASADSETPIFTLQRAPSVDAVLFFSTEKRGNAVRVQYHGDIIVDAWVKTSALSALPPGEMIDQLAPSSSERSAPQMAFPGQLRLVRSNKEVPLRNSAKDGDAVIGWIEPGADAYVLDQVAGWASVVPKTMNVLPPENGHFWAKSSDLGL
ncbi:MAG TPA: hypothetical protein VHV51_07625 [Polyangiaceae bacterium]|jgi:hypothetical protein|nr:hypothetical protein [Polyangiaceae bacterium]